MRLLALATVTADGRPLVGPVDGYLLHGSFYFSSGRDSVRMRHLAARPACSATHLPGEQLAVSVHGRAELFDMSDPAGRELRQAMLDHYLPLQGPEFETWLNELDAVGARIDAEKMFTFSPTADPGGQGPARSSPDSTARAWLVRCAANSHGSSFPNRTPRTGD